MVDRYKKPRKRYAISILIVLFVIVATVGALILDHHLTEKPSPKKATAVVVPSQFSFDGATGWRQGPSNNTSMALFYKPADCFVSIQRNTGTVNVDSELQKMQVTLTNGGYTSMPGEIANLTLQTNSGYDQYQLHQYTVTGGSEPLYGGQEFAFIPLSSGYLKIEGYCTTTDQLTATIPALQAYMFDPSKATKTK